MRRRLHLLALVPLCIWLVIWGRGYLRFDFVGARGWHVGSDYGAVYTIYSGGSSFYRFSGDAGANGRLETKTGTVARPWLPVRTWQSNGDRFWVVEWWAIGHHLIWKTSITSPWLRRGAHPD
jgi:hypothetical protein